MMGMGAIIAIVQIVREAKSAKNLRQPRASDRVP
jgi:hypothetical protein